METAEHLFGECPQTKKVWDLAQQHNWIPSQATINQSTPWLSKFGDIPRYLRKKNSSTYLLSTLEHLENEKCGHFSTGLLPSYQMSYSGKKKTMC